MDLRRITPLILTYNEEANIDRTLDRLTWARRVVVIDSYSEDGTVEIARSYANVDLVQREFDDHVSQWNVGLDQIDTEWALTLDADYVVPSAFVDEVRDLRPTPGVAGYRSSFVYCVHGRLLRQSLYPPRIVLFRPDRARYVYDGHTQRLSPEGPVKDLNTPLKHDDRKSLDRWLDSQRRYGPLEAEKLTNDDDLSFADRVRKTDVLAPILVPLYCLFVKGLILDGWAGWYYTLQRTYAEVLRALLRVDARLRDGSAPAIERDAAE